jgi:N-acetyl-anhydromuramyl-L-alanine amidase AmpD
MQERGWHDIAYHFVVNNGTNGTSPGQVEESNLWKRKIYHFSTKNIWVNATSIAVVLVGNFDYQKLGSAQKQGLINLLKRLTREYGIEIKNIKGHRDVQRTKCPGRNISIRKIRAVTSVN